MDDAGRGDPRPTILRQVRDRIFRRTTQETGPRKIISVHFPKAAGSSLKVQLSQIMGNRLLLDYDHDPLSAAGRECGTLPDDKLVVHGHFSPRRYETEKAFRMTFLRHPVSNLISIYAFWSIMPPFDNALHRQFLKERPSIVDFARYPAFRTLMSEAYFGDYDMNRFDFIGFYETRERDIPILARELGLPLSAAVMENPTPPSEQRQRIEANASIIGTITDLLSPDVAFYESLRR